MKRIQTKVVITLYVIVLLVSIMRLFEGFHYEPIITIILGFAGLFSFWWPRPRKKYAKKRLKGAISFDYSDNNGKYSIGDDHLLFETMWSKASDISIHIYNDSPSIDGVAVVKNKPNISDIRDASTFNFSSRTRMAEEGDIVVLKNEYGHYAALKITDIKDISRSDDIDEVTFEYVINPDGCSDFK